MKIMKIVENGEWKLVRSENYNYNFNKKSGLFMRWGKTKNDDPQYAPSAEILDIEVSTSCSGINGKPCSFCYKSNNHNGKNMSFDTFVKIFNKMPRLLCQVALGIGDIGANPDLEKILTYCRQNDYNYVVPNITINGWNLTDDYADMLAKLTGATAVSRYSPEDVCYDAVKKLSDKGLKYVNIHQMLCDETLKDCFKLIDDTKEDKRLSGLGSVVFLLMKPKGKRNKNHQLTSLKKYKELVDYAFTKNASIGFDSCGCGNFLKAVKDRKDYTQLEMLAEPCESTCFSMYIDVNGSVWPCSFCEDHPDIEPLNILECENFIDDVWNGKQYSNFRTKLLKNTCRSCPIFDLNME